MMIHTSLCVKKMSFILYITLLKLLISCFTFLVRRMMVARFNTHTDLEKASGPERRPGQ